jgi:hypothetical protein
MAFISSLLQAPILLETVAASFASNPTIKRIESYLPTIVFALVTRQFIIDIDGFVVTAKQNGTPVAFTMASAILALENILAGKTGAFVCGVVEIDIARATAPAVKTA